MGTSLSGLSMELFRSEVPSDMVAVPVVDRGCLRSSRAGGQVAERDASGFRAQSSHDGVVMSSVMRT